MNFREIAENRQSCRAYDAERAVEREKLAAVLEKPEYEAILSLDADVCGPTYDFDYASLGPVQL